MNRDQLNTKSTDLGLMATTSKYLLENEHIIFKNNPANT